MKSFRRFVGLTHGEHCLLVSATLTLVALRLGLWVLSFGALLRWLPNMASQRNRVCRSAPLASERVAWAIRVASRYVPTTGNCLVQALATQWVLARRGHPARLCIGVARGGDGSLNAHAWVESDGRVVVGGSALERYTLLWALGGERV